MNAEELCREVAMKVMGWPSKGGYYSSDEEWELPPTLELTGNDALRVVEKMREKGWRTIISCLESGFVYVECYKGHRDKQIGCEVKSYSLPEAVFLAALKAKEASHE